MSPNDLGRPFVLAPFTKNTIYCNTTIVITLFIFITTLCGTNNCMWNIPIFRLNVGNFMHINVNPTKHYHGYE